MFIAFLAGVALTVCVVALQAHRAQVGMQEMAGAAANDGALDRDKLGGPFTLTNQDGKIVSDRDFAGRYLLIYFGYTFCPDICPTGLQSMSRALDELKGDADKIQPLFITVDPARDTPQRLKDYNSAFNPRIVGLTGSAEQIAAVAKEYQVYYEKGEGDEDYEVDHSTLIYLMNPAGKLVATFGEETDPQAIVAAFKKASDTHS
ncbi:MAG: SCO family protein [Alphaproteobacteria bacterium]|nr:SCO family protein [Alphaproteobacteria bacterium]